MHCRFLHLVACDRADHVIVAPPCPGDRVPWCRLHRVEEIGSGGAHPARELGRARGNRCRLRELRRNVDAGAHGGGPEGLDAPEVPDEIGQRPLRTAGYPCRERVGPDRRGERLALLREPLDQLVAAGHVQPTASARPPSSTCKILAGASDARTDGADRNATHRGRVRVRQADDLGEHERFPPFRTERRDRELEIHAHVLIGRSYVAIASTTTRSRAAAGRCGPHPRTPAGRSRGATIAPSSGPRTVAAPAKRGRTSPARGRRHPRRDRGTSSTATRVAGFR